MARRDDHAFDIDPFNAGEPVIPWDDPETAHEDGCVFDDKAYKAPAKAEDSYEAPSKRGDHKGAQGKGPAEKKGPKSSSQHARTASKTVEVAATASSGSAESGTARRTRQRETSDTPVRARKLSARFIILILVFFSLVGGLVSCVSSAIEHVGDSLESQIDGLFDDRDSDDSDYSYTSKPQTSFSDDEAAVRDTICARLDALKEDAWMRHVIANDLSDKLESSLGYSAADLGIDANLWIDYQLDGFTYTISSVFAFDDDGDMFFDATAPSMDAFVDALQETSGSWLADCEGAALTDAQKQRFAEEYAQVIEQGVKDNDYFASIPAKPNGSDWTIDDDDFYTELEYLFC